MASRYPGPSRPSPFQPRRSRSSSRRAPEPSPDLGRLDQPSFSFPLTQQFHASDLLWPGFQHLVSGIYSVFAAATTFMRRSSQTDDSIRTQVHVIGDSLTTTETNLAALSSKVVSLETGAREKCDALTRLIGELETTITELRGELTRLQGVTENLIAENLQLRGDIRRLSA